MICRFSHGSNFNVSDEGTSKEPNASTTVECCGAQKAQAET